MAAFLGRRIYYRESGPAFNEIQENQEYSGQITLIHGVDHNPAINAVIQCDGGVTKWVENVKPGHDPEHNIPAKGTYRLG